MEKTAVHRNSRSPEAALPAKLTRPTAAGLLARERLYALLDTARHRPVVWVAGPAGAGKTSLVSGWLDARNLPCLWYQVDEGDADLSSFFHYLSRALGAALPDADLSLPSLTPEYRAAISVFTRRWFETLFSHLRPPHALVFDNCQDVADPAFHEMLAAGLEALPEGMTVIMISRDLPPAPYARMKTLRRIGTIGWNDLRFLPGELAGLVRDTLGGSGDDGLAALLHERTGGWIAGSVLMLESLRDGHGPGEPAAAALLPPEQRQTIFDYFAGELFSRTDSVTRAFLLKTAQFPAMTGEMARRLTGGDDAAQILHRLHLSHHFTDCLPHPEPVYRYHPLFREFLLTEAQKACDPAELAALLKTAAGLLEEVGRPEAAVELFARAGDAAAVARLALHHAPSLMGQGRNQTLESWLAHLPAAMLDSDPHLLRTAGLCRLPFNLSEARVLLEKSRTLLEERGDHAGALAVYGSLMEAAVLEGESSRVLDCYLERAHELAGHDGATAAMADSMAGTALYTIVSGCPGHRTQPFWFRRAETALTHDTDVATRLKQCNYLMIYHLVRGEFNRMTRIMDMLGALKKEVEHHPAQQLLCLLLESYYIANIRADVEAGRAVAEQGLALARETGVVLYNFCLSNLVVMTSLYLGDLARAEELLDEMFPTGGPITTRGMGALSYLRGGWAFRTGRPAEALEHFRVAADAYRRIEAPISEVLNLVNAASALILLGSLDEARSCLRQAEQLNWGDSYLCAFQGLLGTAWLSFIRGDDEAGLAALAACFAVGREHGIMMPEFWQPQALSELCARALEAGIETDFVRGYIRQHSLVPDPARPVEEWPWPVRIRTFGEFAIIRDGQPLLFSGKVQKKPLELLKMLIALGGADVAQEEICDLLWPDSEGDKAGHLFKYTVRQLRKLLGSENAVLVKGGCVTLSPGHCHTDARALQNILDTMGTALPAEKAGGQTVRLAEQALGLYRGDFLRHDRKHAPVGSAGERYRGGFIRLVSSACEQYEETAQWDKAARLLERLLDIDDLEEDFHRRLMVCLINLGRHAAARTAYSRCRTLLANRRGAAPSPEIEALYRSMPFTENVKSL